MRKFVNKIVILSQITQIHKRASHLDIAYCLFLADQFNIGPLGKLYLKIRLLFFITVILPLVGVVMNINFNCICFGTGTIAILFR